MGYQGRPSKKFGGSSKHHGGSFGQSGQARYGNYGGQSSRPKPTPSRPKHSSQLSAWDILFGTSSKKRKKR